MKVPISWLREYVDVDASAEELGEKLTFSGMELESIDTVGSDYEGIIVAEVREYGKHPGADRLRLCKVFNGTEEVQIVCGASNFEAGDKVALATVKCRLPDGTKIKKSKIRGEVSFGMMCSEVELGIADESDGIMILDSSLEPGKPLAEVLGPPETVLDMEITWNRADCQSIIGIAREIAALYGKELKKPEVNITENDQSAEDAADITIEDAEGCPRYTARVMSGIKLGPSPVWMQQRLTLCGIRPINNVVDITNYVLLECGQPLHAFDYRMLEKDGKARIVVRRAGDGEKMSTLDGIERAITSDMLVIADADKPVALAGVMGGEGTEIADDTDKVLLESAYFQPQTIRKTSVDLGLSTDSSYRFERGVDIGSVDWASGRAAALMCQLAGAEVHKGVIDEYPVAAEPARIKLRFQRVRSLMGVDVSDEEMISILESLELNVIDRNDTDCIVEAPLFRQDLKLEADVIEEIARMYGLDRIPDVVPRTMIVPEADDTASRALQACREAAVGLGCSEIMHYSFLSASLLDKFGTDIADRVVLPNPVSEDHAVLRNSLIPQLGETLALNHSRQVETARIFEMGRVFLKTSEGYTEDEHICIGLMGDVVPTGLMRRDGIQSEEMFLWMKGLVEQLGDALGADELSFERTELACLEGGTAVSISIDGEECGKMGLLNSDIRSSWRMTDPVAVAEISLEKLVKNVFRAPEIEPVPAFPSISRDMALLVSQDVEHEQVMNIISKSAPPELTEIRLFDIYTGEGIGDGMKSIAYSLVYRSMKRTLTDEDANGYHEKIKKALINELKVEIR